MRLALLVALPLLLLTACGTVTSSGSGEGETPDVDGRTFLGTGVAGGPAFVDGSQLRLSFEEGRVRAQAGCNSMFGGYSFEGDTLVAEQLAMTEMGCPQELMDQDTWIAELLSSRPTLALDGDELTVTSGDTVVTLLDRVVADPDRPLEGTEWKVTSLLSGDAVSSVPAGVEASMTFGEDGRLTVSPGCNRGSGTYEKGEGTVTVSAVALTRMFCDGPRGELETAVLEILNAGELTVEIEASQLTLRAGDKGLVLSGG